MPSWCSFNGRPFSVALQFVFQRTPLPVARSAAAPFRPLSSPACTNTMLYAFAMEKFVKLGWSRDPWRRVAFGFQENVHPEALCNKLAFEDADLLCAWTCPEESTEKALHKKFAGKGVGEFYSREVFEEFIAPELCAFEKIELVRPSAADVEAIRRSFERQPTRRECCSGQSCVCFSCGQRLASFKGLYKHRLTHMAPQHSCPQCSKPFTRRDHLSRHLKQCKGRERSRSR